MQVTRPPRALDVTVDRRQTSPRPPTAPARRRTTRVAAVAGLVAAAVVGFASPASAHVTLTPSTTAAGAGALLQFSFSHGCDGSPTTALTIQVPEGINTVAPTRTALWEVELQSETLDPPVTDSHGAELTERVASVTYSSRTPVPDGVRDVVELSVQLPEAEGETLAFPVIQTCQDGETAWIEVPADEADAEELEHPAPTITLTAPAGDDAHGDGDEEAAEADESDEAEASAGAETGTEASEESGAASETDDSDGSTDGLSLVALGVAVIAALLGGAALYLQRRRT